MTRAILLAAVCCAIAFGLATGGRRARPNDSAGAQIKPPSRAQPREANPIHGVQGDQPQGREAETWSDDVLERLMESVSRGDRPSELIPILVRVSEALCSGGLSAKRVIPYLDNSEPPLVKMMAATLLGTVNTGAYDRALLEMLADNARTVRDMAAVALAMRPLPSNISESDLHGFWQALFLWYDGIWGYRYRQELFPFPRMPDPLVVGDDFHVLTDPLRGGGDLDLSKFNRYQARVSRPEVMRAMLRHLYERADEEEKGFLLGRLPPSVPEVVAAAEDAYRSAHSSRLQELAVHNFAESRADRALDVLIEAVSTGSSETVRIIAAHALGSRSDSRVRTALLHADDSEPEPAVRKAILSALNSQRDETAVSHLIWVATDPTEPMDIREHVIVQLRGSPSQFSQLKVDGLLSVMGDPEPSLRVAAIMALAEFGDPWIEGYLTAAQEGQDSQIVRMYAQSALERWRTMHPARRTTGPSAGHSHR